MKSPNHVETGFHLAALVMLVGCFTSSLTYLIVHLLPHGHVPYYNHLCLVATLGGWGAVHIWARKLPARGTYHVVVMGVLFAVLQIDVDLGQGRAPFVAFGIPRVDGATIWLCLPVFVMWLVGHEMAFDLARLVEPPRHDPRYIPPQRRLTFRLWVGGLTLVLLVALTQARITSNLGMALSGSSGPELNTVIYVIVSTLLLAQVRFRLLRQEWENRTSTIVVGLGVQWSRYLVGFVAVLMLFTVTIAGMASTTVSHKVTDPMVRAASSQGLELLGATPARPHHPPRKLVSHSAYCCVHQRGGAVRQPDSLSRTSPWFAVLGTAVLSLMTVLLVGVTIRAGIRRRLRVSAVTFQVDAVLVTLRTLWFAFLEWVWDLTLVMNDRVSRRSVAANRTASPNAVRREYALSIFRSPRELVLVYYVKLLRHADRHGMHRRDSQSPREIQGELVTKFPQSERSIQALTDSFTEARYSLHQITRDDVARLRAHWRDFRSSQREAEQ